jgi:hypothetical protein
MALSFLSGIFGKKPDVPSLPALSLPQEQQAAIKANIGALPADQSLVSQANKFSIAQINQMLESSFPGFAGTASEISQNIDEMAGGKIPTDVSEAVQRSSAARAIGGGFGGSGMHGDLVARDLGLTSLDLISKGIASAESWAKTSASLYEPSMINLSSMFISPSQQAAFDVEERNAQFQRQWMQNQISAMPDPVLRGLHDTVMSLADAYLGGTYTEGMKPGDYGKTGGASLGGGIPYQSSPAVQSQDIPAVYNDISQMPQGDESNVNWGFGGQ